MTGQRKKLEQYVQDPYQEDDEEDDSKDLFVVLGDHAGEVDVEIGRTVLGVFCRQGRQGTHTSVEEQDQHLNADESQARIENYVIVIGEYTPKDEDRCHSHDHPHQRVKGFDER